MGTFVDRDVVPDRRTFFSQAWERLNAAPVLVRPRRAGNTEPLTPVSHIRLDRLTTCNYYFSAGRACAGAVSAPPFDTSRYYTLTLWFNIAQDHTHLLPACYGWLRACWPFRYCYQATQRPEWLETHLALHQALNTGFVELNLSIAFENGALLDRFEEGPV